MAARKGLRVSLIEHFFTDQLQFVNVAKRFIDLDDYYDLVHHIIHPAKSRGKLGGKSAGLFLASQIIHKTPECADLLATVKVPRTWYLTSDGILDFIQYNNLEDVHTQKYMEIDQVRREYPNIVQTFKNSQFPPETVQGLSMVLDDFEGCPIIVRSSSLLEDRFGSAFSGKYKSLFLANQGTKQDRLGCSPGCHRRSVCVDIRPRSDRVPRGARPARRLRRDGHHDPGGGRPARREVLPAGLRRGRLQQQRVSLVGAHQARGRPSAARSGPRDPGRRSPEGRLSRPHGSRTAESPREYDQRGGGPLLSEEARRHQSRDRSVRDRRPSRLPPGGRRRLPPGL